MVGDAEIERQIRLLAHATFKRDVLTILPIAAGLGLRRFYRVRLLGTPAYCIARAEMLEDPQNRPAGIAPEPALEPLRTYLEANGLPVPKSYASRTGIDLLEDLGDTSLQKAAAAATPEFRQTLYTEACDLIARLQQLTPDATVPAFSRQLDTNLFRYKASLFLEWSIPEALGRSASNAEIEVVHETFLLIAAEALCAPQKLSHRDFQSSNLLLLKNALPGSRLCMIDFQGAFLAPPEYDLVCLLRDSYVELPNAEVANHLANIRQKLPDTPLIERMQERFDLLTLSRKGKDHARFLYAAKARGNRRLLVYIPTTLRYLKAAAERLAACDPRLARFADLLSSFPDAQASEDAAQQALDTDEKSEAKPQCAESKCVH